MILTISIFPLVAYAIGYCAVPLLVWQTHCTCFSVADRIAKCGHMTSDVTTFDLKAIDWPWILKTNSTKVWKLYSLCRVCNWTHMFMLPQWWWWWLWQAGWAYSTGISILHIARRCDRQRDHNNIWGFSVWEVWTTWGPGRPEVAIGEEQLCFLVEQGFWIQDIADMFGCCRRTLECKMN